MIKLLIIIFICCAQFSGMAQSVLIDGVAKTFGGRKIVAFQIEDYISEKRSVIASSDIDPDGRFKLEFKAVATGPVYLNISRHEATVYVSPGAHYTINFPEAPPGTIKKFDKTTVEVAFENLPENDINALIRSFNAEYAAFIRDHYYDFAASEYHGSETWLKSLGEKSQKTDMTKRAASKDSSQHQLETKAFRQVVDEFITHSDLTYSNVSTDEFLRDYIKYSNAELELMAGMKRNIFYHNYFMSQRVQPTHPSYMSCFHAYYHHFLTQRQKDIQSGIIKAVNQERNPMKLVTLFEGDSSCLSTEVRYLAVIKGLHDIYYDRTYTKYSVEKTLMNFPVETGNMKQIARNVAMELTKCQEGWTAEDFVVADESGDKWKLSENLGSPTYYMFFATWSNSSLKELQIMQNLHDKYGKQIRFIAVSLDDDYETFKKYIVEHKEQKFTFLFGGGAPMLSYDYDVRTIPHAVMLNTEGKFMFDFTRKPSEGIQMDFDKMMILMKQNQQGPKTWKND